MRNKQRKKPEDIFNIPGRGNVNIDLYEPDDDEDFSDEDRDFRYLFGRALNRQFKPGEDDYE